MNRPISPRLLLLVPALVLWAACSDSSPTPAPAAERGGSAGDSAREPERGGGGATCFSDGPRVTDEVRRTIPFVLTDPHEGYAGEAAMEEETSGCVPIDGGWHCEGSVSAGVADGAPTFAFGDGSRLVWLDAGGTFVAPPVIEDRRYVWAEYTQQTLDLCPECGTFGEVGLSILTEEGGTPIWVGQEGSLLQELTPAFVQMLFGVSARREFSCASAPYVVDCYDVEREVFDHVLETEPEQRIPHATPTRVVTPNGGFDVMWASSEETEQRMGNCSDGQGPARDRGFAASRLPDVFPPCPELAPEEGDDCTAPGQRCSYPDDPDEPCPDACADECRDVLWCGEDSWYLEERPAGCGPPDPGCPADMPEEMDPCSEEGLRCRYEEALCFCSCGVLEGVGCGHCQDVPASSAGPAQAATRLWACTTPEAECPRVLPRSGEPCDQPSGTCSGYGLCFECGDFPTDPFVTCNGGAWEHGHGDCQP